MTLEDFERQYVRSTGSLESAEQDSLSAYRDFLERYVNFRLKVAAAHEAGIPSKSDVREEIQSYRTQLARPFLLETEVLDPIIRELYERQQQVVDVSHILLRVAPGAPPADTLAAYRAMHSVRDSALQGVDFGDLALRHSEDPSAAGDPSSRGYRGRLGYFTGGNLVEPFETYAYETPVGDLSPVFRTQFGYHLLKVHDRRAAQPDIRVSHIMLRPNPTDADSAQAWETLQDLKLQLEQGADFGELAQTYSQDAQSKPRGGDLGMLSYTAPVDASFKDAAFSLEEVGAVSDVVETPYGLHLIQLTERAETPTYEEAYEEIKTLAGRLPRTEMAEQAFARKIMLEHNARIDTARVIDALDGVPGDSVHAVLKSGRLSDDVLSDTFFVMGDTSFTVRDLALAADPSALEGAQDTEPRVRNLVTSFVTQRAIDVEAARLEDRDEEFRRLMTEFRDGLVLFEFMEDSVWAVAEQDTSGLRSYYDAHTERYRWPERTRVISLQSESDTLLHEAARRLDEGLTVSELADAFAGDSSSAVRIDTMMIADSTHAVYDRALGLPTGHRTDVLPHRSEYVLVINDGVEPARLKTFEEARSAVVSEYQQIVEDRVIDRLRRRYDAHTFPERLVRAFRTDEHTAATSDEPGEE